MRGRSLLLLSVLAVTAVSCASSRGVSTQSASELRPGDDVPSQSVPDESVPDDTVPDNAVPQPTNGTIEWGPCDSGAPTGADLECGSLTVPLDYAQPDGETIDIAVARAATANDDERIGSLVFNPGGPGGSGIEFLQSAALIVPSEIAARFDLVSFDPRGVGASTAVDCAIDLDDQVTLLEPGDDAGWDAVVSEAEANAALCTDETTRMSPYFGTNNAARDLDQLRAALGDDRLSYVGFSYGTRLGATYAELFPDRVRALVLDGAVKPTIDFAELNAEQGPSFDRAFEQFAQACDSDADCVLRELGTTQDVYSALVAQVAQLGSLPTTDDGRVLTPGELELGTAASLYSQQLWPILAQGIHDATVNQDGTLLQVLVDTYVGRRPDGSYDNSQAAGSAINCADDAVRPDSDVVRSQSEEAASLTTWFDGFLRASTGCIGAPAPVDPLLIGPAEGAPPILVIGNTGDPATPYEWSVAMADSLASAELFTVEAEGHTAFLTIPCVDPVVIAYLVDLVMPEAGSSCAADVTADVFQPAGEGEFDKVIALFDCLRENGADVPEVSIGDLLADPTGESLFAGIDPTDPSFVAAAAACQDLIGDL